MNAAPELVPLPSTPRPLHIKNKRYPVLLIAGAPADRARELRDLFAKRRGMLVKYHLDYEKVRTWQRPIPKDVDLVVMIKSQAGHSAEAVLRKQAERAGVPVVRASHKWTLLEQTIRNRWGFKKAPPLPLELTSTAYFHELEEPAPKPAEPAKTPVLATVPPPPAPKPPPSPAAAEEAEIRILRLAHAQRDTMLLIRELQARLGMLGAHAILIGKEEVTISTEEVKKP